MKCDSWANKAKHGDGFSIAATSSLKPRVLAALDF